MTNSRAARATCQWVLLTLDPRLENILERFLSGPVRSNLPLPSHLYLERPRSLFNHQLCLFHHRHFELRHNRQPELADDLSFLQFRPRHLYCHVRHQRLGRLFLQYSSHHPLGDDKSRPLAKSHSRRAAQLRHPRRRGIRHARRCTSRLRPRSHLRHPRRPLVDHRSGNLHHYRRSRDLPSAWPTGRTTGPGSSASLVLSRA